MARKNVDGRVRVEILFTPEEIAHIDKCCALAKKKRTEFVRRLTRQAYADAVRCGMIKEISNEQPNQAHP